MYRKQTRVRRDVIWNHPIVKKYSRNLRDIGNSHSTARELYHGSRPTPPAIMAPSLGFVGHLHYRPNCRMFYMRRYRCSRQNTSAFRWRRPEQCSANPRALLSARILHALRIKAMLQHSPCVYSMIIRQLPSPALNDTSHDCVTPFYADVFSEM
jgi:hypothetical protein